MKYRDLLVAILITGSATFIWAEPSKEVVVQASSSPLAATQQESEPQSSPQDGWTYDLSTPDLVEVKPKLPAEILSYSREDMGLDLAVAQGKDFDSTVFEVFVRMPENAELIGTFFNVVLDEDSSQSLFVNKPESLGNNRFRFRGSQLMAVDQSGYTVKASVKKASASCIVSTSIRDTQQSRYSRGAGFMKVKSEPVRLAF